MSTLGVILFLISLIGLVAGLINPSFLNSDGKKYTRREAAAGFGTLLVISFALVVIGGGKAEDDKANQQQAPTQATEPAAQEQLTEPEQIERLVADNLDGETNYGLPIKQKIDVVKQIDGGWGVFVEFNGDSSPATIFDSATKTNLEARMSTIYRKLYTSDYDIRQAAIWAYLPLISGTGEERQGLVYKTILKKARLRPLILASTKKALLSYI